MGERQDYEGGSVSLKGTVVIRPLICHSKRKLVRADCIRYTYLERGGETGIWQREHLEGNWGGY